MDEPPNIQIRFGQEILTMNSWTTKKQYDVLCQALGSGMNMHMTENDLIRDILNLGPKLCQTKLLSNKQSKLERVSLKKYIKRQCMYTYTFQYLYKNLSFFF